MKCPFCGAQIADDCLFCTECGKELPKGNVCPHCGASVNEDDVFCTECGKRIDEVSPITTSEPIKPKCPHCGAPMNEGDVFCTICGKKIDELQSEDIEEKFVTKECPNSDKSVNEVYFEDVKDTPPMEEIEEETQSSEQEHADTNYSHFEVEQSQLVQQKNKLLWIIGAILLLCVVFGTGLYCFSRIGSDSDSKDAKLFIEGMYKDFYEPWNTNRFDGTTLRKYFTSEAMKRFYVESDYEQGAFSYSTDFLVNSSLGEADFGDKVVSRTIEPEKDGWFLVTNIWDVIQKPVRVHLKVKPVDGSIKIVDIKLEDDDEFEIDAE